MTNKYQRGERFSELLSKELKGSITASDYSVKEVCEAIGLHPATFSNYASGKRMLPSDVFANACDFISVDPAKLVDRAYDRLEDEMPFGTSTDVYGLAANRLPYDPRAQIEAEQEEP